MRLGVREATPTFTFESSAPMLQVSGSTRIDPWELTRAGDACSAFKGFDFDGDLIDDPVDIAAGEDRNHAPLTAQRLHPIYPLLRQSRGVRDYDL